MKLVFINHNICGIGTYLRASHLARHLAGRGHDVTLLTTSRISRLEISETAEGLLKIIRFPDLMFGRLRNGICPWNTLRRILYLRRRRFDLIHAFDTRPAVVFPALYLRSKYGIPLVIDWADWWGRGGTIQERSSRLYSLTIGYIETFFEEYFRKFADGATTISSILRERLVGLGYPKEKILLLRNGTVFSSPMPLDKESCRRTLGLDSSSSLIGHLGTLFEKDRRLLLDSLSTMVRKRGDIRLLLIGRHRLKLDNYSGVRDFLIKTGEIPEDKIRLYLSSCDILVLPLVCNIANNGRWPSKINDYFATGRPIVSTPIGDIRKIFEEEGIGVLAKDRPEKFSRALEELLRDKARQDRLGTKARVFAEKNLDWMLIAGEAERFYNNIASIKRLR